MNSDSPSATIESILLLETEPVDTAGLVRISGLSVDVVEAALTTLRDHYADEMHGIELQTIGGGWTIAPKREQWEKIKERYGKKSDGRLSRAAMETLSIIAYSQPITRAEIENLRGVAADGMIRQLLGKNLIQEVGKKDAPGRPIQYGTTRDFLRIFRLSSIADLPRLDEIDQERFDTDA